MFLRLLFESFRRQRRRKLLAGIAILLGATAVTAMLALATTVGDRIHRELAVFGANIIVTPQADALAVKIGGVDLKPSTGGAFLHESDLAKLRTIFWANNIIGVSPELPVRALMQRQGSREAAPVPATAYWFHHDLAGLQTGAPALHPWWTVRGTWPSEAAIRAEDQNKTLQVAIGGQLARHNGLQMGDRFAMSNGSGQSAPEAVIIGIVSTGDALEDQVFLSLRDARRLRYTPIGGGAPAADASAVHDAVARVDVSAKTRPEDAFARRDPDSLSPKQRDVWYCRPYANSIAFQIREAIPGADAQQVRQVEQSEGNILARISGLMWLISAASLVAAAFAVSAAAATAILERQAEIGLMRSLGASRGRIAALFYVESALLAMIAGGIGFVLGSGLAAWLGARIFAGEQVGSTTPVLLTHLGWMNPVLLPVVLALALLVALLGSTPAIRRALGTQPSAILRAAG